MPPQHTYFGLETSALSREEAEKLTCLPAGEAPDVARVATELPFSGGVFLCCPYTPDAGGLVSCTAEFLFVSTLLVIDHANAHAYLVLAERDEACFGGLTPERCRTEFDLIRRAPVSAFRSKSGQQGGVWEVDVPAEAYADKIVQIQSRIAKGDLKQAILSVGLSKTTFASADDVFDVVRRRNASPHIFLFRSEDYTLVGASPAMHLRKIGSSLTVETDAGTRRIGATDHETDMIETELLSSAKDLEEQKMIVDETIRDLRAIAAGGKVEMPVELEVRRLGGVMHLFTVLEAQIRDGVSAIGAVLSCFPPAAVTGAPRRQAMEAIREVERGSRGLYGGVLGLIGFDGSVDTAIILRSACIEENRVSMRCGGGITHASVAMDEYRECMNKAHTMMECVAEAEALARS